VVPWGGVWGFGGGVVLGGFFGGLGGVGLVLGVFFWFLFFLCGVLFFFFFCFFCGLGWVWVCVVGGGGVVVGVCVVWCLGGSKEDRMGGKGHGCKVGPIGAVGGLGGRAA